MRRVAFEMMVGLLGGRQQDDGRQKPQGLSGKWDSDIRPACRAVKSIRSDETKLRIQDTQRHSFS